MQHSRLLMQENDLHKNFRVESQKRTLIESSFYIFMEVVSWQQKIIWKKEWKTLKEK